MELQLNGIKVSVGDAEIARLVEKQLKGDAPAPSRVHPCACSRAFPTIGEAFEGGIYAGMTIHDNRPMALVLLPGEADSINWKDAQALAEKQGGELPSRIDQLVLWKNLKSEFKDAWYWSGEQHASSSDYAWGQRFRDGYQDYNSTTLSTYRARAVRRLEIQ